MLDARNVAFSPAASVSRTGHQQAQRARSVGQRRHRPDHPTAQMLRCPGLRHVRVNRLDRPVDQAGHRAQRQDHRQRRQERDGGRRGSEGEGRESAGSCVGASISTARHSRARPPAAGHDAINAQPSWAGWCRSAKYFGNSTLSIGRYSAVTARSINPSARSTRRFQTNRIPFGDAGYQPLGRLAWYGLPAPSSRSAATARMDNPKPPR